MNNIFREANHFENKAVEDQLSNYDSEAKFQLLSGNRTSE